MMMMMGLPTLYYLRCFCCCNLRPGASTLNVLHTITTESIVTLSSCCFLQLLFQCIYFYFIFLSWIHRHEVVNEVQSLLCSRSSLLGFQSDVFCFTGIPTLSVFSLTPLICVWLIIYVSWLCFTLWTTVQLFSWKMFGKNSTSCL